MENYHVNPEEPIALDFTSSTKKKYDSLPVLDLSCKKISVNKNLSYMPSPSSSDNFSTSPPSSESNIDNHNKSFNDDESTYIVTTPPDSPKKNKCNNIYSDLHSQNRKMREQSLRMQMFLPKNISPRIIPLLSTTTTTASTTTTTTSGGTLQQMQLPIISSSPIMPSTPQSNNIPITIQQDPNKKTPRPFKAYPKDPLSFTARTESIYDHNTNGKYNEFRRRMLESVRRTNEGTNIKMRRISNKSETLPTSTMDDKDAAYWERRKKNNEAAKRSRDARRAKEDEIAIRAAYLEQENVSLRFELMALKQEMSKFRTISY